MHGRRVLRLAVPALSLFFTVPGLAQKLDLVPPGFEEQQIRSEADYVKAWAKENGWDDSGESVHSYLKTELTVTEPKLGTFRLCRLANKAEPRGGEQTIVLIQKTNGGPFLFSPMFAQHPSTPEYKQMVTSKKLQVIRPRRGSGTFLWIEILEELKEHNTSGDTLWSTKAGLRVCFWGDGAARRAMCGVSDSDRHHVCRQRNGATIFSASGYPREPDTTSDSEENNCRHTRTGKMDRHIYDRGVTYVRRS